MTCFFGNANHLRYDDALEPGNRAIFQKKESEHDADAGCALRAAAVTEDTGVHGYGAADAGAGNWRQCRDLHPGEYGVAAESAGGGPEDAGESRRHKRLLCG